MSLFVFRFGVEEISQKTNLIIVKLSYSLKESTLRRKFGNLPLKYCRLNIDNEQELKLFEKAVRTYTFNCVDEEEPERKRIRNVAMDALPAPSEASTSTKETIEVLELFDDGVESQDFR